MHHQEFIWRFNTDVSHLPIPNAFTYPFIYEPHALVKKAAAQVQSHLIDRDFGHNFGFDPKTSAGTIGKMFGVLVVKDIQGELGFISAFSGNLADENHHAGFVPPVFDILEKEGYFRKGEEAIKKLNLAIGKLQQGEAFKEAKQLIRSIKLLAGEEIKSIKRTQLQAKLDRKQQRRLALSLNPEEQKKLLLQLATESTRETYLLKSIKRKWSLKLQKAEDAHTEITKKIKELKQARKDTSAGLQERMFTDYKFLNAKGKERSLLSIFNEIGQDSPPSGAGDCAAPKLLQYAFLNKLQPLALGEFWWGSSPPAEERFHKHFYPSCRSKCEPILGHMLQGLFVEKMPMQSKSV